MLIIACKGPTAENTSCDSKDCFITRANNCQDANIIVNETFGTVNYASKDCVFTKTLLSMNDTEEIRKLFEGKTLSCKYEQSKFDSRLVNTLVFGIEYCEGELKDRIVDMLAFL
jgi:phospholipid N-methyltransferase